MQDEIYLLNKDKEFYNTPATPPSATIVAEPGHIATAESAAPQQPVGYKYLGGNKKNFLIVVHYQEHDFIHEKHLAALESTLVRLGFNRDDVAIFNKAGQDAGWDALSAYFKPAKLLIMGRQSLPAGIAIELNKPMSLNGQPALFTFGFDEMMDSVEKKKVFWEQMKQL